MDRKKTTKPKGLKNAKKPTRVSKQPDGKNFLVAFGLRLRHLREKQEMSQDQLGFEVGMSRVTINRIERGHYETGIASAYLLARALDTPVSEFFNFSTD